MRYNYILLILALLSTNLLRSQGTQQFGKIFKKSENQAPVANAGEDVKVSPGSTITISGEKSGDLNGDVLQFEWSLPPSLMEKNNYLYDQTDTVKTHKGSSENSVDVIKTYTQNFLLDIPKSLPVGSKHIIKLTVRDKKGLTSADSFLIEIVEPDDSDIAGLKGSDGIVTDNEKLKMRENSPDVIISIQSRSIGELVPMQKEAFNSMIYHVIRNAGMKGLIDPKQYRRDTLYTIVEEDSANPAVTSKYNLNCLTDSCAAQNAIMDGATHVLSWSFNRYNMLELHFFHAKEYLKTKRTYSWSIFTLPVNKSDLKTILLPSALAIDNSGDLIVANSSTHSLYKVSLNQKVEKLISEKVYNADLTNPAGIDVGTNGNLYVSDRDNNRVFSMSDGKYNMLADRTSSLKIEHPTSIRVLDNGSIAVLCEGDQSIRSISDRGRISTILNPGVIEGMKDIAIDNKGDLYVVSRYLGQVFKVVGSDKVELVAGAKKGTGLRGNGITAKEAELFDPIAIDFDLSGRLYIAEAGKGLIRYIEDDGLLYTMAGGGFSWDGKGYSRSMDVKLEHLSYMRLGPGPSIYLSQMIDHAIRVVSVKQEPSWIAYDINMTPMHLIYEYGVAGLEPYITEIIPKILKGYLPKQKKSFGKRFKDFNKNMADYFKERPLLFAVLLLFGSQATSAALGNTGSLDMPPDFPF